MNLRQIIRNQKLSNFNYKLIDLISEEDKISSGEKTSTGVPKFWYKNQDGKTVSSTDKNAQERGYELATKEDLPKERQPKKVDTKDDEEADVKVKVDDETQEKINDFGTALKLKPSEADKDVWVDEEGNAILVVGDGGQLFAGPGADGLDPAAEKEFRNSVDDFNRSTEPASQMAGWFDTDADTDPAKDDEKKARKPETAIQASAGGPNVDQEVKVSDDGKEVTITTETQTPPPELTPNPQTPESIRALREWQKSEDGLGKNKDCNEESPTDKNNPAKSFTKKIEPNSNAFKQVVESSKTLTSVGDPQKFTKEVNKMLKDAGITEPYPFPKQYVELLGRLVTTNSKSVDSAKIGDFIEGAGAGMIRSQAGEVMTMMITTLPDEQATALMDKVREATEGQDKKTRIVDPSWADAALKNREAIIADVRSTYGPDAKISAGAWDVKDEVVALGMQEPFEENKGYSTDAYFRVELEGDNSDAGPQLVEASLKKDLSVYFYNGGMTKAYKPAPPKGDGMGLDEEEMRAAHQPPPENFKDYNFADYSKRRNESFNIAGQAWNKLPDRDKKKLIATMMNPADPPAGAGKEVSADFAESVKKYTNPRTIAAAGTDDPDKMALFMLSQLNNFKEDGSFDKTDAVGPQDRVMKAVMAMGQRPTRSGSDQGTGWPFGDVMKKIDEDHKNYGRDFAAAVITNESLRNSILESIRREFPIKACADGEEIMAIGDLAINRAVCQQMFGTSNFNEIQENLQIQDIKGKPTIVYQATAPGVDPIPISLIEAREKGIGYSAMTLNLKLAESGLRGPLQKAQAALQEIFNALLSNIISETQENTLFHHWKMAEDNYPIHYFIRELNKDSLN